MVVERNYRVDGVTRRKNLFTLHVVREGGARLSFEVARGNSAISKKLDELIKRRYHQRKMAKVWMENGEIVDIVIPEPRG